MIDKNRKAFKRDVLDPQPLQYWPQQIDFVAREATDREMYPHGYPYSKPPNEQYLKNGEDFDDITGRFYAQGIGELTDDQERKETIERKKIGDIIFNFQDLSRELSKFDTHDVAPEKVLGQYVSRGLQRGVSDDQYALAGGFPRQVETPQQLIAELGGTPELFDVLNRVLAENTDGAETITTNLGKLQMNSPLWEHQLDALATWSARGTNGYANMATATGKTVLGLATIAWASHAGDLHPSDKDKLAGKSQLENKPDIGAFPSEEITNRPHDVLIVTTDAMLTAQWVRLFQEHCNTPPEFTKITDNSIELPNVTIDVRRADALTPGTNPDNYRVAIFDEIHNYGRTTDGGWGENFVRFAESSCPVLAMTGSMTDEFKRTIDNLDAEFPEISRYTLDKAREDGIIPDFSWHLRFAAVENTSGLEAYTEAAKLIQKYTEPIGEGFRVSRGSLKDQTSELSDDQIQALVGEYDSLNQLSKGLKNAGNGETAPTGKLEKIAKEAGNRSVNRLNLRTSISPAVRLAREAMKDERPTLVLTRDYSEAERITTELNGQPDGGVVQLLDQDLSQPEQQRSVNEFDELETKSKVLVGPGKNLGQAIDIKTIEVGINLSRPGSGMTSSVVQRLGRLLRKSAEKQEVEFHHLYGIQPSESVLHTDAVSYIRNVSEFFEKSLNLESASSFKLPSVRIESPRAVVEENIVTLERSGAEIYGQSEDLTRVEKSYIEAIENADDEQPVINTDWFTPPKDPETPQETAHTSTPTLNGGSEVDARQVNLDPVMVALIDVIVSTDSNEPNTRQDVIHQSLKQLRREVIENGIQSIPERVSHDRKIEIKADPLFTKLLDTVVRTSDQFSSADEYLVTTVLEQLNTGSSDTVPVENYSSYRFFIEGILESESSSVETVDQLIQVAIKSYLHLPSGKATDGDN